MNTWKMSDRLNVKRGHLFWTSRNSAGRNGSFTALKTFKATEHFKITAHTREYWDPGDVNDVFVQGCKKNIYSFKYSLKNMQVGIS